MGWFPPRLRPSLNVESRLNFPPVSRRIDTDAAGKVLPPPGLALPPPSQRKPTHTSAPPIGGRRSLFAWGAGSTSTLCNRRATRSAGSSCRPCLLLGYRWPFDQIIIRSAAHGHSISNQSRSSRLVDHGLFAFLIRPEFFHMDNGANQLNRNVA